MFEYDAARSDRQSTIRYWLILGLAAAAVVGLLVARSQFSGAVTESLSKEARPAPDFRLSSLDGETFRLTDLEGRVVVLELWATWCGPCRLQAKILHEIYGEVSREQVEFLAISLGERREVVASFVDKEPFDYPVLLDPKEELGLALEVIALPTVVVVDADGMIRFEQPGITDAGTIRRVLAELGVVL